MTDDERAAMTLGRRLDALARTRLHALMPRPAWSAPLAVALRHAEEMVDILGERFERTEMSPRSRAELPVQLAEQLGQVARHRPAPDRGPSTVAPQAEPWLPEEEREGDAADGEVRAVPADVRSRMRREVGPAADRMRVHAGPLADAHARTADADAVTMGRDVYLRQGRWAPRRDEGVALLVHEATHVAALIDPGEAWRRAVGAEAEETLARARERSLLGPGPAPTAAIGAPASVPMAHTAPAIAAVPPASPPVAAVPSSAMRAGVERDLTPAAPTPDLDALRRGVIAEVMQRLRSEIERGA